MLSRSEAVKKLIEIRKLLADRESELEAIPDDYHGKLKTEVDELLVEMIGVPEAGRHQVNNILNKAVKGEIKPKTAVVAVHEIYNDYQQKENENSDTSTNTANYSRSSDRKSAQNNSSYGSDLEELYESGYR